MEELDISNRAITEITGIEDFSTLKVLNFSRTLLNNGFPVILDLSQVNSLEELYMNSDLDNLTSNVNYVNLSNNPNLVKIEIRDNWALERINLLGSDLNLPNLIVDLSGSYACIQVTDANAAQNGEGIYGSWSVCCDYDFSENCNLGTENFSLTSPELYPNPARDLIAINSPQTFKAIIIYNVKGELVKNYVQFQETYSVADLPQGIYLVEVQSVNDQKQFLKFIKK